MKRVVFCATAAALSVVVLAPIALAQSGSPILAAPVAPASRVLPRNTPVSLTLNETLNTKSSATKRGNTFTLSVEQNVLLDRHVVIPRGSRALGTVVKRTGKGGFGKSGKLEVSLDYIEVGDTRIPIQGSYREEGEGNSTATIATFVFISMLGSGLITGHSAEIPAGRRFSAWTKDDIPVQFPEDTAFIQQVAATTPLPAAAPTVPGVLAATPLPSARPRQPAEIEQPKFGNRRIRCVTCR